MISLREACSKRIYELLNKTKQSQYKIAKKATIPQSSLQTILYGPSKSPKFTNIYLIAQAFDMSLSEFFDSPFFSSENIDI